MKNFAKRVSALVLALVVGAAALCPAALAAASLPDLPRDECVVDDANILSDSTTQTIIDLNAQLEQSCNGAQIGVLTVDYTGNYSTEDYATQAFNAWGISSASENNGVLILLVMESPIYEDGDYYVTYGDGFRNTTLESQASAIAQTMENDFAACDYDGAVTTCANNVADTIASVYGVNLNNGSYDDGSYAQPDDGPTTFGDIVLGIVILFMSLMVMLIIVLFVFRVFIAPIGHAVGWNWGPFAWGYMAGSARRRYRPGPPPPPGPGFGPGYGPGYGPGPRNDRPRPPRNNNRRPPRPPMGGGFGGFISSDKNIETPLFLGMDYDEAVKEAEKMGITLVQEGEDYSSFYDTGCIIYQSVNEGTMIGEGTKIGVKVSLGLTEEEMPNVVGKSENAAIEAITRLVGDVAEIRYVHDADAKPSEVIKQEPEAGASITAKSRIILTISKGDEDTNVTVPNVVNDTLEDAKASLTAVGLTVGNVSYAASDKVAEGKVITQTVAANKSVPSGSVVNLVVSSGADTQENENNKPSSNTQTQGTKYFTINAPSGSEGSVYVRVVKEDADGVYPVVDTYRDASEFPYSVSVTGKGSGTVTCYIDNVQQWSQSVNFSG